MCIYWKAPLYTFTDHTLSAVISELNTKKTLVSQETLGYKSEALNIYIYKKTLISKYSHMKLKMICFGNNSTRV
jgi:hypothetical protein